MTGLVRRRWLCSGLLLALSFAGDLNSPDVSRLIADSLPYGVAPGGTIWGLENASRVFFGVAPAQLTLAQAAILAAAPGGQPILRCDPATPDDEARWRRTRARAEIALRGSFPAGDARVEAAIAEVRQMVAVPRPAPLAAELTIGLDPRRACFAAGYMRGRGQFIASTEILAARPEFSRLAERADGPITDIQLSVDVGQNRLFKRRAFGALAALHRDQRGRFHLPLSGAAGADTILVTTDAAGRIQRIFASTGRANLDQERQLGSLTKLTVAAAAAAAGRQASATLCNRRDEIGGVVNADGTRGYSDCNRPVARVSVDQAFGQSVNLPVLDLARSLSREQLRQAADAFGVSVPPGARIEDALVLGMARGSPRRWLGNMLAYANGLAHARADSREPHIVVRARTASGWLPEPGRGIDLSRYFIDERARAFLHAAGTSPLRHPRGTLRGAVSSTSPLASREAGKTGTVTGPRPERHVVAKLAAGAAAGVDGFAYFGVMAAPSRTLGAEVSATALWRLLRDEAISAARSRRD